MSRLYWRGVFFNARGSLRAFWRIGIFALACVASLIVVEGLAGPVITQLFVLLHVRGVSNEWLVEALAALGGTVLALRYVDKRPWSEVWLGREAARPSLFAIGFVIGLLAIGVPIVLLIGAHWLNEAPGGAGTWLGAAFRISLVLLPAALFEELLTRGFILSALRESLGWAWAICITSVGFGLLHLANNGVTVESIALVILAGFFLAGVVYATRSLYAAWMAHFAWNFTMAVLFHTAVSGMPMESPDYRYVDAGPDWATGGEWGPEGGIPAGLGMIAVTAVLFARRKRRNA